MTHPQTFHAFYEGYLGLNNADNYNGVAVCVSPYRDQPINKHYFYKLIAVNYQGQCVLSCSQEFQHEEILWICQNLNFDRIGDDFLPCQIPGREYEQSCMYRMLLEHPDAWEGQAGLTPPQEIRLPDGRPVEFLYLETNRKYLAVTGDTLLGYCKLSDIILGYGNIVVWVDEPFRRLGLAKALTALTLRQCRQDGILPMYIVKSDNLASVALAGQLGFQTVQKEWIASVVR